jgi:hypothetical protein
VAHVLAHWPQLLAELLRETHCELAPQNVVPTGHAGGMQNPVALHVVFDGQSAVVEQAQSPPLQNNGQ